MADSGQVEAPNAVHPQVAATPPPSPTAADAVAALVRAARARVEATQMVQTSAGIAFTGDDEQSDADGGAR